MPNRTIAENRLILRRYIWFLNNYRGMANTTKAKTFFIVLHNFLAIEDKCYDQCLTLDRQINVHLNLLKEPKFYASVSMYYDKYYDPNHKIRFSLESIDDLEEARYFLDNTKDVFYDRLILDSEFEELWEETMHTI